MAESRKGRNQKRFTRKGKRDYEKKETTFDEKVMGKPVPDSSRCRDLSKEGRDNDPMWYFTDARLAEQTSNLSFHSFLGEGNIVAGIDYKLPSIMTLRMNPSPGNSYYFDPGIGSQQSTRSGINLACTKLFTLLSTYSGRAATTYAPQDVGMLILAMGEIVSCIEDIRRLFGVSYTFSERNRALPKLLIESMGIDYDDFKSKRSIYIDNVNALITRFNQLPILGNIAYILKCRDMYQKIYTDSPNSAEAQIIYMSPQSTWILDESSYSGGTILKTVSWNNSNVNVTKLSNRLSTLDNMVEALFGSSTLNIIYSDLLNLASKVNVPMFKLDYITNDYVVVPEYNLNFLLQVHNLDSIGAPSQITDLQQITGAKVTPLNDVYPDADNNCIIYNPAFSSILSGSATGIGEFAYAILDMMSDQYTTADLIEAMRYKVMSNWLWTPDASHRYILCQSLPDHYCVTIDMYADDLAHVKSIGINRRTESFTNVGMFAALSKFDYAPFLYVVTSSTNPTVNSVIGDTNFYTDVPSITLDAVNRIIYQCLFEFRV